jgi:hypothetical protein
MSASALAPANRSTSRIGMPSHTALPTSPPPTSFETQVSVIAYSSTPMPIRSSNVSSTRRSTIPSTTRRHPDGSTLGTVKAVSTR